MIADAAPEMIFRGIIHCGAEHELVASRGHDIYVSHDSGTTWQWLTRVPASLSTRLKAVLPLGRRLFRSGVHHIIRIKDEQLTVFADGYVRTFDRQVGSWNANPSKISGSRPLCVAEKDGIIFYGEYKSNPERGPIHIYQSSDKGESWQIAHTITGVRHIHGVFVDPYTDSLWFTTGDNDSECGIWRTDENFSHVDLVQSGSQQVRAVELLFTQEHVYFGTDTPLEANFIYRFERDGGGLKRLASAPSSVFYGSQAGGRLFFATVCEPSETNETQWSILLGSFEVGSSWRELMRARKDIWPMKLFQYGQIKFPRTDHQGRFLWYSLCSLENDNTSWRIELERNDL